MDELGAAKEDKRAWIQAKQCATNLGKAGFKAGAKCCGNEGMKGET